MELGQVFTKAKVADFMASLFTNDPKNILDPCFGEGVFITAVSQNLDTRITGYEIDNILFKSIKEKSNIKLYNKDFLLSEFDSKFDGIILNPPYVRHEKINDLEPLGITKEKLNQEPMFSNLPSTSNLYIYFIVKCINLLEKDGQMIIIFPSSWKGSKIEESFWKFLNQENTVVEEYSIKGKAFENNPLVDVMILKIVKSKDVFKKESKELLITEDNIVVHETSINKSNYVQGFHDQKVLTDYSMTKRGLTTGGNQIFINPSISENNDHITDVLSSPKQLKGFSTDNAKFDKILFINQGEEPTIDEKNYLKKMEKEILINKKPKTIYNKILNNNNWYEFKKNPTKGTIIFSYIVRENIKFIMNDIDIVIRDNFYVIKPHIDKYLLIALLNNTYTYLQLESSGKKHGNGLLKLQKYDIDKIVLPNINKVNELDIELLIKLGKSFNSNLSSKEIITQIDEIISKYAKSSIESTKKYYKKLKLERLGN